MEGEKGALSFICTLLLPLLLCVCVCIYIYTYSILYSTFNVRKCTLSNTIQCVSSAIYNKMYVYIMIKFGKYNVYIP